MGQFSHVPADTMLGIMLILFGCCANVISLEYITRQDKGAGHLITFAQFLYITLEGFYQNFDFRTFTLQKRVVPFKRYLGMTLIFFIASVANNKALDFSITMPVHTVFRSSGLTATLLIGYLFYDKKYTLHEVLSCLLVSVGIVILTLADMNVDVLDCCRFKSFSNTISSSIETPPDSPSSSAHSSLWMIGIALLTACLFLQAWLGHVQDFTFKIYGKSWREAVFYTHLLSMPGFLFVMPNIIKHVLQWIYDEPLVPVHILGAQINVNLFYILLANLIFQSICIKGVFLLTSSSHALTCTLVITFRKFLSLLLSIMIFQNPFSLSHWAGACAVFGGIIWYSMGGAAKTTAATAATAATTATGTTSTVQVATTSKVLTSTSKSLTSASYNQNNSSKGFDWPSSTLTQRRRTRNSSSTTTSPDSLAQSTPAKSTSVRKLRAR